jgi:hypothetical protein
MGNLSIKIIEDNGEKLPEYDHTRLSDYNRCPTYGIIRRGMNLRMPGNGRSMPLEAGSAAHECFSAMRLASLGQRGLYDLMDYHGRRLFGEARWLLMLNYYNEDVSDRRRELNFILECLYSGPFYDDPKDKRRTVGNIEELVINYYDRFSMKTLPVWVENIEDTQSRVGIEIPFRIPICVTTPERSVEFAFVGRIDGLHVHPTRGMVVVDNKTASRITDAWENAYRLSHQMTGYVIAAKLIYDPKCTWTAVHGTALPQPKKSIYGSGIVLPMFKRSHHHYVSWAKWITTTIGIIEKYPDPLNAPKYTHSCDSYFSTCSMLPICDSDEATARRMLDDMQVDVWSPLHEVHIPPQRPTVDVLLEFDDE